MKGFFAVIAAALLPAPWADACEKYSLPSSCCSQISGVSPASKDRSASVPSLVSPRCTMKLTVPPPGASLTHAKRPYSSSPRNGFGLVQSVPSLGSIPSPHRCRPQ